MIAIKGMEMPKNCSECNITTCKGEDEPWNYVCSINLKDIDFNETKRAEHCPLVEIVTCKDCKYCDFDDSDQTFFCNIYGIIVCSSHFCSNGERRK